MSTTVEEVRSGPGCLTRAVYFLLIGWWLTGIWSAFAWGLLASILGLPIGVWMINRLPQVLALMPARRIVVTHTDAAGHQTQTSYRAPEQPFLLRVLYFLVIGWWFSAVWMAIAYCCAVTILGLPLALWLYNRIPWVLTLKQV